MFNTVRDIHTKCKEIAIALKESTAFNIQGNRIVHIGLTIDKGHEFHLYKDTTLLERVVLYDNGTYNMF